MRREHNGTCKGVRLARDTRLSVTYTTVDVRIPALAGFVVDLARALRVPGSYADAVRQSAARHPEARGAFPLDATDAELEERFALDPCLTFPNEVLPAQVIFERGGRRQEVALDSFSARDLTALLECCARGDAPVKGLTDELDEPLRSSFELLLEHGLLVTDREECASQTMEHGPGVTRLQHAGLLYRGRDVGLLVDPHLHSTYELDDPDGTFSESDLRGLVDAIVVSHGHQDHAHLPTLLSFPRDTPIVVPRVTRASMLSPDLERTLRAFGFPRVRALGWGESLAIGDLELHALPFYGEQPLLNEPARHRDLVNFGNTYVVRHETYTSWFLIDSGRDWRGSMQEVATEVRARFGPIDLLASNLRPFSMSSPLYITSAGHYWLALTPDQQCRFAGMADHVLTLAPAGVADVCALAAAKRFLPYAHWWAPLGAHGLDEHALITELDRALRARGAATEIVPWTIGDHAR